MICKEKIKAIALFASTLTLFGRIPINPLQTFDPTCFFLVLSMALGLLQAPLEGSGWVQRLIFYVKVSHDQLPWSQSNHSP